MNRTKLIVVSLTLVLFAAGCAVHQELEVVEPTKPVKAAYSLNGTTDVPGEWWKSFNDSKLNALIEETLANNLTLQQAWSRLDQARSIIKMNNSGKWPQLNFDSAAQRQRTGLKAMNPATFTPSNTVDTFTASATLAYQLDVWNKIDSSLKASILDYKASRKDIESTAQVIVSSVVDIWFSVAEQKAALELLEAQVEVNKDYLDLVEARFAQGVASAVDVFQQRLQVENTRNQLPQAKMTLQILKNQLAVLLGEMPGSEKAELDGNLPVLPGLPEMGIPADLIRNRPDVKAAELRIFAADKQIAVAIADRFPSIAFSTSGGARAYSLSDFFDSWFANLAGSILGPIFDGGRRAAEVERTRAALETSVLGWEQALLVAVREVEDALASEIGQKEVYSGINKQVELARATLDRARSRYVNGLTNYLTVLNSLQALQQLERVEIQTRRSILSNRVKLYAALGSDWTESLEKPVKAESLDQDGE